MNSFGVAHAAVEPQYDAFCHVLTVTQSGGETLTINKAFTREEQEEVIEVTRGDAYDPNHVLMRIFACERSAVKGIVVVSPKHSTVAFLSTASAVTPMSAASTPRRRDRRVLLYRSVPMEAGKQPYAVVEALDEYTFVARAGSKDIAIVRLAADGRHASNFFDGEGRLMAAYEADSMQAALHVAQGGDAALVLSVVIAAEKLR
jgi:hypothetical protein